MKTQAGMSPTGEHCDAEQDALLRVRAENLRYAAEAGKPRGAYVLTFGCQQNEADSERLAGMAEAMGYTLLPSAEEADLILVNTCAIREHAELKALSIIGQYKHLKAKRPSLIIGVCGCMVTQEHRCRDIQLRYPYVDFVVGTASLQRLPQLLLQRMSGGKRRYCIDLDGQEIPEGLPVKRNSTYRAWVSIMYGCNNFCSYCIVPYVRGRERSRERDAILAEVRELVASGYRDITLLGQNVNSWGKERQDGYGFANLLADLDCIEGDFRLRFMTSHPKDADRRLIDVMAQSKHIAHQFHLPLQSGSDTVLRAMNRHYDTARYLEIVDYMKEKMPDVTLTSDIIVGFPKESEEDFEGTLRMLRRVEFDMLYSFLYSPRKGTPAAEWEPVEQQVKSARFERLLALQNEIGLRRNQALLGQTLRVLCDGVSKNNPDLCSGRTEGGKIVFFKAAPENTGHFVWVRIERVDPYSLYGARAADCDKGGEGHL